MKDEPKTRLRLTEHGKTLWTIVFALFLYDCLKIILGILVIIVEAITAGFGV